MTVRISIMNWLRLLFVFIFLSIFSGVVLAEDITAKNNSKYTVLAEGDLVQVEHQINIVGGGDVSLVFPGVNPEEVTLKDQKKADVPVEFTSAQIKRFGQLVPATKFTFQAPASNNLTLVYKAKGILTEAGENSWLYIPALDRIEQTKIDISVPLERGLATIYGSKASDSSIGGGEQTYTFTPQNSRIEDIRLLFGQEIMANLKWESSLKNGSWWWKTAKFTLPPDTNQQTVSLESLSPKPDRLSVDVDGNIIAEYDLWPKRSIKVTAEAKVYSRAAIYNTTSDRTFEDIPEGLYVYTSGEKNAQKSDVVLEKLASHFDEALGKINTENAKKVSNEFYEILLKDGFPARKIVGLRLIDGTQAMSSWLEVFVPGIGWMTVDVASGQFSEQDFTRLALGVESSATSVDLNDIVEPSIKLGSENLPEPDFSETKAKLIKYVLLPGLSLGRIKVQMPPGQVLDGTAVAGSGVSTSLGSLAPLQQKNYWVILPGSAFWSQDNFDFGLGGDNSLGEVLAEGSVSRNFLLALGEVLMLALAVWLVIKWRRTANTISDLGKTRKQPADQEVNAEDLLRSSSSDDRYE